MKRNGFTLIEMMVVVAIIAILAGIAGVSFAGTFEKTAIRNTEVELPLFLRTYIDKSFYSGKRYSLKFDEVANSVAAYEYGESRILGEYRISNNLRYIKPTGGSTINTTETGNMSSGYTIYILSKDKKKCFLKITGKTQTPAIQYCIVKLWKPQKMGFVYYDKRGDSSYWRIKRGY